MLIITIIDMIKRLNEVAVLRVKRRSYANMKKSALAVEQSIGKGFHCSPMLSHAASAEMRNEHLLESEI
ncbi:unnamed protein product [Leptosia nina]|uniref:Uncharacterized protein n=1 Tax=Leptosia nina TaxID=320188 RepID=A0AAV1JCJ2_9NEOP